jgi:hypothetical protein
MKFAVFSGNLIAMLRKTGMEQQVDFVFSDFNRITIGNEEEKELRIITSSLSPTAASRLFPMLSFPSITKETVEKLCILLAFFLIRAV